MAIFCRPVFSFCKLKDPPAARMKIQLRQLTCGDWVRRARFGRYECVHPFEDAGVRDPLPPADIRRPPYALGAPPPLPPSAPECKNACAISGMRHASRLARELLDRLGLLAQVGTTTADINDEFWRQVVNSGAYPSPLNYLGFPRSICTSVNNVAVHGIPDKRPLVDGDIITIDVTVYLNGFHGDCADTFLVGNVDEAGRSLVKAAYNCRDAGISVCKPGVPFSAIAEKIMSTAEDWDVTVVPAFAGHGIGSYFHGPPEIYHTYNNYPGVMEEGMTFTVEPVVAQGSEEVLILEDGWTAIMLDDGRAAQTEHTVLITKDGVDILTK